MSKCLSFTIVGVDDGYPAVEVRASTARYEATTTIWMNWETLSEFADNIAGYPRSRDDERHFDFGTRRAAGATHGHGFCDLHFARLDAGWGVRVEIEDSESDAGASFWMWLEAAEIDRLVSAVRTLTSDVENVTLGASAQLRPSV